MNTANVVALLLMAGAATAAPIERITAIVGVTVVHPEATEAEAAETPDSTVILAGSRIQAVGPAATTPVPRGATVINGKGQWIIPGLIDSHVHFFQSGNLYTRPDVADFNNSVPYATEVARNKARLSATFKVWLASGVTSVADVGGPFWNFDVREAARRTAAAPRVVVAGPLLSMVSDPKLDLDDPPIIKVSTPEEARSLVKRELARHPDFIKVWFIYEPGDDVAKNEATVRAAAEMAHAAGVRLAVHATELIVAKAALRAGADYLVHSVEDVPVDAEFLALAKARHIIYCPTLFVGLGYHLALSGTWRATEAESRLADPQVLASMHDLDRLPKDKIPARVAQAMAKHDPPQPLTILFQNLRTVSAAGVTVAMGTDAGNIGTLHGPSVFRELQLMVDAGLTPLEVLRDATVHGAEVMNLSREIGVIEAGRRADVVLIDADPLASVQNLSQVHAVFKNGVRYTPAELLHSLD